MYPFSLSLTASDEGLNVNFSFVIVPHCLAKVFYSIRVYSYGEQPKPVKYSPHVLAKIAEADRIQTTADAHYLRLAEQMQADLEFKKEAEFSALLGDLEAEFAGLNSCVKPPEFICVDHEEEQPQDKAHLEAILGDLEAEYLQLLNEQQQQQPSTAVVLLAAKPSKKPGSRKSRYNNCNNNNSNSNNNKIATLPPRGGMKATACDGNDLYRAFGIARRANNPKANQMFFSVMMKYRCVDHYLRRPNQIAISC